jgi:hypothetical protein
MDATALRTDLSTQTSQTIASEWPKRASPRASSGCSTEGGDMKLGKAGFAGAVIALALATVATPARAQAAYRGSLTLPFEVQWGRAVLPAGEYTLALTSISQPMRVIDDGGRTRAFVYGSVERPRVGQGTFLLVTRDGSKRTVRSLNCPEWGVDLVYRPFTRAERDLLASGRQEENLAVRVASR